ncbi:phosphate regulon transcriptional regulatory protein PhoB [Thermoanaerobacter kivui]|uniref:Stage 0 sporulation protein A homolog n=1 Tax=Thermoanaerobacter kivui TaxID=2325 RepID=A0A097ASG0_THEKI|nr:response regulator [Thermoanaerobacter kivui]AIS52760.1 phosphate regulon transcriptional regulatory protein PhoB [Thermoanaerobacter kivui]
MKGRNILIVDDNKLTRKILKDILENAGYGVLEAKDGEEALQIYRNKLPDMVILDIVMPGMNGFDLLRILRKEEENLMLPIILLTSQDNFEEKIKGLELGADDYLVKPFNDKELLFKVNNLFQRIEHNRMANPLTGLRGNIDIKEEIKRRIKENKPYAILYIDLDNFKSYNDYYGFLRGDNVIKLTAKILSDAVNLIGNERDFLGHIGGDDFVIITTPDKAEEMCKYIISRFDEEIKYLYDDEDRKRGYIETISRTGEKMMFPLVSISIAIVTNEFRDFKNDLEISAVAAELKKKLKIMDGSCYLKDRRKS